MGFDVHLTVYYRGKSYYYYTRNIDDHDKYCAYVIDLIIRDYIIYKDYIKDMLAFLNRGNEIWTTLCNFYIDSRYCMSKDITIDDEKIVITECTVLRPKVEVIKIKKQKNPQFIDFINRRFLLPHICEKYYVPKDIQQYLINFFF